LKLAALLLAENTGAVGPLRRVAASTRTPETVNAFERHQFLCKVRTLQRKAKRGMTRRATHLILLLTAIVLTAASRVLFEERTIAEGQRIEAQGRRQRIDELVRNWNSLNYTDEDRPVSVEALLKSIKWDELPLTGSQTHQLREDLADTFKYLQNPEMEHYLKLKTQDLPLLLSKTEALHVAMEKEAADSEGIQLGQPKERIEAVWSTLREHHWSGRPLASRVFVSSRSIAVLDFTALLKPYSTAKSGKQGRSCVRIRIWDLDMAVQT
jgi:hypothetical protein